MTSAMRPSLRMYRAVFMCAALLFVAVPASAQSKEHLLSGVVVRSDTLAPIGGAAVVGSGKAVVTDAEGRFSLVLPAARVGIEVTAEGFFLLATMIDMTERDVTGAQFALAPNASFTSAVNVVGAAPTTSPAATAVAPSDVLKTAGSLDNVFRTLQTLPGVAAAQEFSSRLTVRGGAPDQNLTVMDGVEIHDPYRLFGLTSAFNPETIRRFELATGGFSAKYGDRLSSLLIIENRDGDSTRRLAGTASLSVTDANVVLEGGLPKGARGSWLVTGRRTYYDLVAARVTHQDFPGFGDLQAKGVWESATGRKLTVFGLRSRQSAAINIDETNAQGEFSNNTDNDLAWTRFDTPLGRRGHAMTVAGYSSTLATVGVSALFEVKGRRSNAPADESFGTANVTFSQRLRVRDLSLRHEFLWSLGAHTVETGAELHHLTTGLQYVISGDRNPAAANGSSVQGGAGLPDLLDSNRDANRGGAWLIDTWRLGARANIEAGLRLDRAGINSETTMSPRLAASIVFTPALSVRAAIGQYTQSPGYEKAAQSDYVLDFTSSTAGSLRSERAQLASLGIEQVIGRGLSVRVESYYKRLTDVLIGRIETEAERLARLARYDFPAALATSVPTDAIITTVPTNDGRGRAYGVDLLVSRMTAPADARVRGWASYTWGRATREAYGRTYPFEYDRRQAVSAVLSYRASPKWELASTVRWATGFPRTAPLGVRVAGAEVPAAGVIRPIRDTAGRLVYEVNYGGVSNLNAARLPDFARADVRATWKPRGVTGRWEFYLEVINVLNRKNAGALTAELAYDPASDRPRIVEKPDQSIPRLPTLGLRWRF
jgi:hypothetical protein